MSESRAALSRAIPQINAIENSVDRGISEGAEPSNLRNFNGVLNTIQANLEEIASSTHFADSEAVR